MGSDVSTFSSSPFSIKFQSTLPVWGATERERLTSRRQKISIHAPRVGSDPLLNIINYFHCDFNPRSPCGERQQEKQKYKRIYEISIHAPRVGSDNVAINKKTDKQENFNPRSPCGERLWWHFFYVIFVGYFNPRSPCGERRRAGAANLPQAKNFNPRSPCGERPQNVPVVKNQREFQSTLPVWGATIDSVERFFGNLFQSTLPVWGATPLTLSAADVQLDNFNPRSPCGERRDWEQLTRIIRLISIHAPRVGSDGLLRMRLFQTKKNFNPRSPCGERLFNRFCHLYGRRYFNPRSPCGERQLMDAETWITPEISIHAPRVGSDKSL